MWKVVRHSGVRNGEWKVRYEGSKSIAIDKFEKIKKEIRRGGVGLVNPKEEMIAKTWIS